MARIKFNKFLDNFSLNIVFTLVVILLSLLPVTLATGFIASTYFHEKRLSENQNIALKKEVELKVNQLVTDVGSRLKIATQIQDVVDVLLANSDVRPFIENRAYGRLTELIRETDQIDEWALISTKPSQIIFSSSENGFNGIDFNHLPEPEIFLAHDDIFVKEFIKLDDQNLAGPNSSIKGIIIARINQESLVKKIPQLIAVTAISHNNGIESFEIDIIKKSVDNVNLVILFTFIIICLFISITLGFLLFREKILVPLQKISKNLLGNSLNYTKNEIVLLEKTINSYIDNLKLQESEKAEKEKLIAANMLASQVAHDIRSPLTALNIVLDGVDKVSEEKRILVRNAIQRINDIANDLLVKSKASPSKSETGKVLNNSDATVMLSSTIDILVSEKRIQYRDKFEVEIGAELSNSYGLFAKMHANEFKRMLSNLINNSVEALKLNKGKITVALGEEDQKIKISLSDNGMGIPSNILSQLGNIGLSFGKEGTESGSGLGIHHAVNFISSIGGTIFFANNFPPASGVTVSIYIPKAPPPEWFVKEIKICSGGQIVALDDDQSIHGVWQERISSICSSEKSISLVSFTSAEAFKIWVKQQNEISVDFLFLVDYELLGQKTVGLDLIEELGIQNRSVLVSSRYDETPVLERCNKLGIKIIPKAMAGLVPIEILAKSASVDAILIDDDPLVHMTWKISAKKNSKSFVGFKNPTEFFLNANSYDRKTAIVIDLCLGKDIKGNVVAEQIYALGFRNIFIGTGATESEIPNLPFDNRIIGKEPTWHYF